MFSVAAAGSRPIFRKPSRLLRPKPPRPPSTPPLNLPNHHRPGRPIPERPQNSPKTRPLGTLHKICARIDDELIAIESLKLPKFLRMDVFVWPFLLLAGGLSPAWGWAPRLAGPRPRSRDWSSALAAGIGAYISLSKMARPGVVKHALPLREGIRRGRTTR